MPALVTRNFRVHNAKQFKESIDETSSWGGSTVTGTPEGSTSLDDHYYLYIGKTSSWSDDNNPDSPFDTQQENTYESWNSMIAAKKVLSSDVSHVIPRYNWTSGTIYSEYADGSYQLHSNTSNPMVVMTTDFNVYKCLDNANNSSSTSQPISVSTEASAVDDKYGTDNYKWKYLYTITAAEALKFVTPNYIPVKTLRNANAIGQSATTGMGTDDGSNQWDIEKNSVDGGLDVYQITNAGSNYKFFSGSVLNATATTTFLEVTNPGDGSLDTADGIYNNSGIYINNTIKKVTAYVYDDGNSRGQFTLDSALSATASGSFSIFPQCKVYGDGTGATARCAEGSTSGTIGAVFAGEVGSNYTSATVSVIQNGTGATGSGAAISPVIGPKGGHGYDLISELGGNFVMINTRLEQSESGKFTTSNDFRKIGLIKNPNYANATHRSVATAVTQAVTMRVGSVTGSNFLADNVVVGGTSGAQARIVDVTDVVVNSVNYKDLRIISTELGPTSANKLTGTAAATGSNLTAPDGGTAITGKPGGFQISESVTCSGSTATINALTAGELDPYSGSILYVENRSPVARASDQTEDIKLIIEF
tara:strand:+ start:2431 stop:4203 length:1773 start_codon:yes stop_codon:yes gene_type:complete